MASAVVAHDDARMDAASLTSAVFEQTWQYDKVDETLFEKWLAEIQEFEKQRKAAAVEGPVHYQSFWKSVGGFRAEERADDRISRGDDVRNLAGEEGRELSQSSRNSDANACYSETYLTEDLWRYIFVRLDIGSLPPCAGVCRQWRQLVKDGNVWAEAFKALWKLSAVVGTPSSTLFWRGKLSQFAISHELSGMDTIASLAVKYNVQVMDIRRQNMMMSDHGIHTRERLLIPITKAEFLEGKECFVEMDVHARREVAVLYLDGLGRRHKSSAAAARARVKAAARLKEKVTESFKKSLGVDDGTASFYLTLAGGNVRGAYAEYLEDLQWERRQSKAPGHTLASGVGGRSLPLSS